MNSITLYIISLVNDVKKQYVGETGRPFRKRIYEHQYSITNQSTQKDTPVSRHFKSNNHSVRDMVFHVVEYCGPTSNLDNPDNFRKRREMFWIWKFSTIYPQGINMMI